METCNTYICSLQFLILIYKMYVFNSEKKSLWDILCVNLTVQETPSGSFHTVDYCCCTVHRRQHGRFVVVLGPWPKYPEMMFIFRNK